MLLRSLLLVVLLSALNAYAQRPGLISSGLLNPLELSSKLTQPAIAEFIPNETEATFYCNKNYTRYLPENGLWKCSGFKESPAGKHYSFQAFVAEQKIIGLSVRIHCRPDGKIQYLQEQLPVSLPLLETTHKNTVYLYHNQELVGGTLLQQDHDGIPHWVFHHNDAEMFDLGPVKMYFNQQDTPLYLYIFHPNPIVSRQTEYTGMFRDMGDADNDSLTAARVLKTTRGSFIGDRFYLRNNYLRFGHVSDPVVAETTSTKDTFDFTRSQNAFEQVNAFYHLNEMSAYLEKSGFGNLLDSIIIDAHAFNGGDLSAFDPSVYPYTLEFGEGGVDDAEDAQVVIHEFGHSLSTIASPGTVNGSQRRAMEEGNADYICMSYSREISEYAWDKVFSWDGHNEFWDGFSGNSSKRYPEDLKGNSDNDREIWSTALMCIWEQLGKSRADSLVLNHLFYQASNASMPQMAQIILDLNRDLFNNEKHWAIQNCFAERGILGWSDTRNISEQINQPFFLFNSEGFAQNLAPLRISFTHHIHWHYDLIDVQGKIRLSRNDSGTETRIDPYGLEPGMYLLRLKINDKQYHTKLIRH